MTARIAEPVATEQTVASMLGSCGVQVAACAQLVTQGNVVALVTMRDLATEAVEFAAGHPSEIAPLGADGVFALGMLSAVVVACGRVVGPEQYPAAAEYLGVVVGLLMKGGDAFTALATPPRADPAVPLH